MYTDSFLSPLDLLTHLESPEHQAGSLIHGTCQSVCAGQLNGKQGTAVPSRPRNACSSHKIAWKNISGNYIQIHSSTRRPHSGPSCIHLPPDATQTPGATCSVTSNTQPSQLGVALIACTPEGRGSEPLTASQSPQG